MHFAVAVRSERPRSSASSSPSPFALRGRWA